MADKNNFKKGILLAIVFALIVLSANLAAADTMSETELISWIQSVNTQDDYNNFVKYAASNDLVDQAMLNDNVNVQTALRTLRTKNAAFNRFINDKLDNEEKANKAEAERKSKSWTDPARYTGGQKWTVGIIVGVIGLILLVLSGFKIKKKYSEWRKPKTPAANAEAAELAAQKLEEKKARLMKMIGIKEKLIEKNTVLADELAGKNKDTHAREAIEILEHLRNIEITDDGDVN